MNHALKGFIGASPPHLLPVLFSRGPLRVRDLRNVLLDVMRGRLENAVVHPADLRTNSYHKERYHRNAYFRN
jgi:hypothetical protein